MSERTEVFLGDYALILDGRVIEILHSTGLNQRIHVNHVAVEAKPRRDGSIRIHVGIESAGIVQQGAKVDIDAARVGEVTALFEQAKSRRDPGWGT